MRKYKSILILLVVFIVLILAYFIVNNVFKFNKDISQPTPTQSDIYFTLYSFLDVKTIEINNQKTGEALKFSKNSDGSTWKYLNQPEILVDNSKIDDIVSKTSYFYLIKLVEENPKDLSKYGLDVCNTIKITLLDGSTKSVEIGNATSTKDAYYFKSSINNNVYTINYSTGAAMFLKKEDVYSKMILDFTSKDIQNLTYDRNGVNIFQFYFDPKINMHRTSRPMKDFEVTIESFDGFTAQLIALKKMSYIAPASEASKYGFDKPTAKFIVETLLQKQTLIFGKEVIKDSQVYAMLEGSNDIFLLDISELSYKDIDVKSMITDYLFWPSIRTVSNVNVKFGQDVADCNIEINQTDTEKNKYTVNGALITKKNESDSNYFLEFYKSMTGLQAVKFEEGAKPSGSPLVVIVYTLSTDNSKVKFEFFSKDNNYAYVVKNGEYTGALVDKISLDTIGVVFNEMMKKGI